MTRSFLNVNEFLKQKDYEPELKVTNQLVVVYLITKVISLLFNASVMNSSSLEPQHRENDNGCIHGCEYVRESDKDDIFDAVVPWLIVRTESNKRAKC